MISWLLNTTLGEKLKNKFVQIAGTGLIANILGYYDYTALDLWDYAVGLIA